MLKKLSKTICLLMTAILVLSSSNYAVAASTSNEDDLAYMISSEEEIQRLFDQRAELLTQIFQDEQEKRVDTSKIVALNAIDRQLVSKGVTFLTLEEVYEQFPETKGSKELALSGETMSRAQEDSQNPRVVVPTSTVNSWASYRSTYTTGGVTYNIQKLIAQPIDSDSPLTNVGYRTVTYNTNWIAGVTNVLSSLAEAGAGALAGYIPGASLALTLYDAAHSFVTGISTTTEVDVPHIAYSWSNVTTASFIYVRLNNQTDDYQWLSLISTKTTTAVGYQLPQFSYKKTNGTWVIVPEMIQGTRTIYSTPNYYNSTSIAVSAYNSVPGGALQNCVSYVQISGPESKSVQTIHPCFPSFPIHCE